MKKEKDKIINRIVITYTLILLIVFILKLIGLDYFGLDIGNPIIKMIDKVATKYHLINVWYSVTLYIYTYCILSITCKENSKRLKLYVLLIMPLSIGLKLVENHINITIVYGIIDILYLLFICVVYNIIMKKTDERIILRFIIIIVLTGIYQLISMYVRATDINPIKYSFIEYMIFDIDYILLMIMTYKIYDRKEKIKCETDVGFLSDRLILLKKQLKKFLTRFTNNKNKNQKIKKTNQEKFEERLFFILYFLWNMFTVFVVLMIAKLNDGLVECLFITFAFLLNKTVFGKAFHMKRMLTCFITSNLIYYTLVRMSFSVGISFLIPIILGTLLAYFMSMLAKYKEFELYKGMPKEDLETACKIHKLNKYQTKILVEFYCDRKSDLQIARENHYSVESIKKQKRAAKEKLKKL